MIGISIYGEIIVYKKEYGYSTTIKNKDINGNWNKMYITVQLPKGEEVEDNTHIQIIKGFLSFYTDKNGQAKVKAVIQEYQVINMAGSELPF